MARTITKKSGSVAVKLPGKAKLLNKKAVRVSADGRNFGTITTCSLGCTPEECPVSLGETNGVYRYQQGCRAKPCRTANSEYYKEHKLKKKAAAAEKSAADAPKRQPRKAKVPV